MERKEIKGKKALFILGYIALGLGALLFALSIICFVVGANKGINMGLVGFSLTGILLIILSVIFLILGICFVCIANALVATKGSIKMDNLAIGTVNILKCDKCGHEVSQKDIICPNCGQSLKETKKCPNCSTINLKDSKFCSKCGKEFN